MKTILLNILVIFSVQASASELFWVQLPGAPQKFVVTVEEGQTPQESLNNYISQLDSEPQLTAFVQELKNTPESELSWGRIALSLKKKVLLLANNIEDMGSDPERVMSFQKTYEEAFADVFVLPVAAMKAVSPQGQQGILKELSKQMDVVTAMGGADIDPALYNEKNTDSIYVNPERDKYEALVLRDLIAREKVFVVGVCRGHQLVGAVQGLKLVQDIPGHNDSDHNIQILATPLNYFERFTGIRGSVEVNSYHHQAVIYKTNPKLSLMSVSDDGIAEAFEFKNAKGITVQFHPEMMDAQWAKELLRNAVRMSSVQSPNSCESLLSAS